jgi:type IV pilus assembly protein PilW
VSARSLHSQSGFTLVELLVGVVVSLIAIAGAVVMLQGQTRSFQGSAADRALQETGRMALGAMSQDIAMAGYGVEPAMVFDFGQMTNVPMERAPQGAGKSVTFGGDSSGATGFACGPAVTCRDAIDGPDELVFQYRNPYFNHRILKVTSSTVIEILGPLLQPIRSGQVLQAVCLGGDMIWAYVRASAEVSATQAQAVPVGLDSGVNLEFPHQNEALANSCFPTASPPALANPATPVQRAEGPRLFEMERVRYFIQSYDAAGTVVNWNTPGSRPYLMVDRGLLSADGTPALEVVAPDVEDLQVSYVFPLAAVENQVVGSTTGTRVDNSATGIDLAPAGGLVPTYSAARLSAVRTTHYPSNVRAVRIAIVVRSPNTDSSLGDATIPAAGNRPAVAAGDPGYRRTLFQTSVAIPNMESRAPFIPTVVPTTDSSASILNVGGG